MKAKLFLAASAAMLLVAACGRDLAPTGVAAHGAAPAARAVRAVPAPEVTTVLSPNQDDRNGAAISAIILHHTAMASGAEATARFFQDPKAKVSSHYVVDRTGAIIRCVADNKRAWHAGKSQFNGQGDVNTFSIGIEICNVGDGVEPYPEAQVQAVIKLVAWLAETYHVPVSHLTRHRDICIPAGRKSDTSDNFDQVFVAKAVQALLDGKAMPRLQVKAAPAGYDPTRQTRTAQAGDSWASIADDVYDAPTLGPVIARLNPGVTLAPGVALRMPTSYNGQTR